MAAPITVTMRAGRFEATYLVTLSTDPRANHEVKVVTRTGNRTLKPGSKIWNRVTYRAYLETPEGTKKVEAYLAEMQARDIAEGIE